MPFGLPVSSPLHELSQRYGVDAAWTTSELPAGCTSFAPFSTPLLCNVMQSFEDQAMSSVPPFPVGSDFESAPAENNTKAREAIAVVVEHQIEDVQVALANAQIETDDGDADQQLRSTSESLTPLNNNVLADLNKTLPPGPAQEETFKSRIEKCIEDAMRTNEERIGAFCEKVRDEFLQRE